MKEIRRKFSNLEVYGLGFSLVVIIALGGASNEWNTLHIVFAFFAFLALTVVFIRASSDFYTDTVKVSIFFFSTAIIIFSAQLIPLPHPLLNFLGSREVIQNSFEIHGLSMYFMPLSMHPIATVTSALSLLLPFLVFLVLLNYKLSVTKRMLLWIFPSIASASVLLGFAQVYFHNNLDLYLYSITNYGLPTGLFANVNHQGTMTLIAIPFIAELIRDYFGEIRRTRRELIIGLVIISLAIIVFFGLIASGSLAAYIISIPILIASFSRILSKRIRFSTSTKLSLSVVTAGLCLSAFLLFSGPLADNLGKTTFDHGALSRLTMYEVSFEIFSDHWLFGTGLGSFADVYRLYEDPYLISNRYVNHAHNDYLEWAIETGVFGITLFLTLLFWVGYYVFKNITNNEEDFFGLKYASILALSAILLHSVVDYPIRTPSIAVITATCLAIIFAPYEVSKRKKE